MPTVRAIKPTVVSRDGKTEIELEPGQTIQLPERAARGLVRRREALPLSGDSEMDLQSRSLPEPVRDALDRLDIEVVSVAESEDVLRLHEKHISLREQYEEAREIEQEARNAVENLKTRKTEAMAQSLISDVLGTGGGDEPTEKEMREAKSALAEAEQKTEALRRALDRVGEELRAALQEAEETEREQAMAAHKELARSALSEAKALRERIELLQQFEREFSDEIGAPFGKPSGLRGFIRDTENRLDE